MAVVGLGGLGHMGVKLGAALGAHVTMITTTPSKGEDARELGAHDVIISTDAEQMQAAATRFDFILNTIPVSHEIDGYLQLLGRSGRMVIVGALTPMPGFVGIEPHLVEPRGRRLGDRRHSRDPGNARFLRRRRTSIPTSSSSEMDQVNEAYERLLKNDVRYRFVIDMSQGSVSEAVHPVPEGFNARIGPARARRAQRPGASRSRPLLARPGASG